MSCPVLSSPSSVLSSFARLPSRPLPSRVCSLSSDSCPLRGYLRTLRLQSLSSAFPFSLLTLTENFSWALHPSHSLSAGGCFPPHPHTHIWRVFTPLPVTAVPNPCLSEIPATGPSCAGPSLLLSFIRLCDSQTFSPLRSGRNSGCFQHLFAVPGPHWALSFLLSLASGHFLLHPSQTDRSTGHIHFLSSVETPTSEIMSSHEPPRPPVASACSRGHSFHSSVPIAASHDCLPVSFTPAFNSSHLFLWFYSFVSSKTRHQLLCSIVFFSHMSRKTPTLVEFSLFCSFLQGC